MQRLLSGDLVGWSHSKLTAESRDLLNGRYELGAARGHGGMGLRRSSYVLSARRALSLLDSDGN